MNHELGEPSIQKVAQAGRIRWAVLVARMLRNFTEFQRRYENVFGGSERLGCVTWDPKGFQGDLESIS